MDALLVFDCLMYLNRYYYFMFTIANLAIWVAKYSSSVYETPHIGRDAYFAASLTISELLKLLCFRKLRHRHAGLSVSAALFFTLLSLLSVLYVFVIQYPHLKLELCLDIMLFGLLCIELLSGCYTFLPCCKPQLY